MNLKLRNLVAATLTGSVLMGFGATAMADSTFDLINALVKKGVLTEEEAIPLMKSRANDERKLKSTAPKITTTGKFKVQAADKSWSFQPIGRVMWDAIAADEDGSGTEGFEGTELRRARLGFQGNVYEWKYKFEADFAGGDASIKDAYIARSFALGKTKAGVKIGQSHIPFGLNTKISSKYMSFMDRPWFADGAISPARQSGVVASLMNGKKAKTKWGVSAGYTSAGSKGYKGFSGGSTDDEATGNTFAMRGWVVPWMQDKKHLVQVGAGYLNLSDDPSSFKFDQRLVSHMDNTKHLKAEVTDFDGSDAYTVDAMGIFGPFHTMAEYVKYEMDSKAGNDVEVDGFAIEAGYFLTGESLKWKKGYTSGIKPNSSSGAWQIAARFETTEIEDPLKGDDEADKFTIGVNYYPRQNLRLMLNYDKVTDLKVNGANADYEPSALKFRAQAYW